MVLNLTEAEAVVLNEIVLKETGRYIFLGRHMPLNKLRAKLKRLARKVTHG